MAVPMPPLTLNRTICAGSMTTQLAREKQCSALTVNRQPSNRCLFCLRKKNSGICVFDYHFFFLRGQLCSNNKFELKTIAGSGCCVSRLDRPHSLFIPSPSPLPSDSRDQTSTRVAYRYDSLDSSDSNW